MLVKEYCSYLDLQCFCFFSFFFKDKETEFHEKYVKNTFNRWGMLIHTNYFSKTYIVCYRKMPKKKNFTVSFPIKTPFK